MERRKDVIERRPPSTQHTACYSDAVRDCRRLQHPQKFPTVFPPVPYTWHFPHASSFSAPTIWFVHPLTSRAAELHSTPISHTRPIRILKLKEIPNFVCYETVLGQTRGTAKVTSAQLPHVGTILFPEKTHPQRNRRKCLHSAQASDTCLTAACCSLVF